VKEVGRDMANVLQNAQEVGKPIPGQPRSGQKMVERRAPVQKLYTKIVAPVLVQSTGMGQLIPLVKLNGKSFLV